MAYDGDEFPGVEVYVYILYRRLFKRRTHAVGVREVFYSYYSVHWRGIPFPLFERGGYGVCALVHREGVKRQDPAILVEFVYEARL